MRHLPSVARCAQGLFSPSVRYNTRISAPDETASWSTPPVATDSSSGCGASTMTRSVATKRCRTSINPTSTGKVPSGDHSESSGIAHVEPAQAARDGKGVDWERPRLPAHDRIGDEEVLYLMV